MKLSIGRYLISCIVVVGDERISHFNAGGEAVCPGLNLRLDVLMVGDDQPCRRNIPVATDRQTDGRTKTRVRSDKHALVDMVALSNHSQKSPGAVVGVDLQVNAVHPQH